MFIRDPFCFIAIVFGFITWLAIKLGVSKRVMFWVLVFISVLIVFGHLAAWLNTDTQPDYEITMVEPVGLDKWPIWKLGLFRAVTVFVFGYLGWYIAAEVISNDGTSW